MEHTDGSPICELTPSIATAVDFARQVLEGIEYLHDHGLVHGALTDQSIVVDKNGRVRIERMETVIDPNNQSQPADDIKAIGNMLHSMATNSTRDSSESLRKEVDAVARKFIRSEVHNTTQAQKLLSAIALPTSEARPPIHRPTVSAHSTRAKKRTTGETDQTARQPAKIPILFVSFLIAGVTIAFASMGILVYVLTRPAPSVAKSDEESIDRWWDEEAQAGTANTTPIDNLESEPRSEPKRSKQEIASGDDGQAKPPPKNGVDLGKAGAINSMEPDGSDTVQTQSDVGSTKDTATDVAVETRNDKPSSDTAKTIKPKSDQPEPDKEAKVVAPEDPFANLARRSVLPLPNVNEIHSFGKFNGEADPTLSLLGTDVARLGKQSLQIVTGKRPATWRIESTLAEESSEIVAAIAVHDGELQFRWSPSANRSAISKQLQNCILSLRSGNFQHEILLRDPAIELPTFVVSCDGARFERGVKITGIPPLKSVQFAVIELSGEFNNASDESGMPAVEPSSAKFGETISITAKSKGSTRLRFDLSIGKRRNVVLSLSPFLQNGADENGWLPLTRRKFVTLGKPIVAAFQALPETKKKLSALRKRMSRAMNDSQEKDLKAQHDAQLRIIESAHTRLVATRALCDALDQKAQVRLRIFYTVGERQIDLAVSPPFADSAEGT